MTPVNKVEETLGGAIVHGLPLSSTACPSRACWTRPRWPG